MHFHLNTVGLHEAVASVTLIATRKISQLLRVDHKGTDRHSEWLLLDRHETIYFVRKTKRPQFSIGVHSNEWGHTCTAARPWVRKGRFAGSSWRYGVHHGHSSEPGDDLPSFFSWGIQSFHFFSVVIFWTYEAYARCI